MSDTTPVLDEAFERMAAASFELPNGFVSHGAMACEALAMLDCTDDIDRWARRFARAGRRSARWCRPVTVVSGGPAGELSIRLSAGCRLVHGAVAHCEVHLGRGGDVVGKVAGVATMSAHGFTLSTPAEAAGRCSSYSRF